MTDIGEAVTLTTKVKNTAGAATDPAAVAVTVTDPAGVETTPTVTNPAVGTYEAVTTPTAAGTWRYRWVTTGPAGVDTGTFVVDPDPPDRLEPLATVQDLEDSLGRALTDTEAARAPALLKSASSKVRSFCRGRKFSQVADDVIVLPADGSEIRLPQRPVTAVTSVKPIKADGTAGSALAATAWTWNAGSRVQIADRYAAVGYYEVTYSHGSAVIPDAVVDVVVDATIRTLSSPTTIEGATQVTVGQVSAGYQQGQGTPGRAVRLSRGDKDQLIDAGFRRQSATVGVRL